MRQLRLVPSLVFVLLLQPASAADGIRRCEGADGVTIYTDRPCEAFDAVERNPEEQSIAGPVVREQADAAPALVPVRTDCSRDPESLRQDAQRALERRDVNALAGLYLWSGTGSGSARHVMDRLERLVAVPAASVELVYPEITPVRDSPGDFPPGTPPENPLGLRIVPFLVADEFEAPARELGLVQRVGCWWLHF